MKSRFAALLSALLLLAFTLLVVARDPKASSSSELTKWKLGKGWGLGLGSGR